MADAASAAGGAAELFPILPGSALAPGGAGQVGNKAWNLMRMAQAGLPVPPAFVLPTAWCGRAGAAASLPPVLGQGIRMLEDATGLVFGGTRRPLLVSVRSGAAVSMPGMMETVLDVGLNAVTVEALIRQTGNPRLAWDSYRRLVQGYAEVVAALPTAPFDALVAAALVAADAETERDLDHRDLRTLTRAMVACYGALAGHPFSDRPRRAAPGRGRGGAALLERREGCHLSPPERDRQRRRHGGHGSDDGFRQCRWRVRRRGRLHAQSSHRRA
jgi:pyruvate,orthophosphate dikinase